MKFNSSTYSLPIGREVTVIFKFLLESGTRPLYMNDNLRTAARRNFGITNGAYIPSSSEQLSDQL